MPTSPVDVGEAGIDSREPGEYAGISIDGTKVGVFRVNVIENADRFVRDSIEDAIRLHPNLAKHLGYTGDIDTLRYADIRIDLDLGAGPGNFDDCSELTIRTDAPVEPLKRVLRQSNSLVHEMTEVAEVDGALVEFDVVDMTPSSYRTTRVTEDTVIKVVGDQAAADISTSRDHGHTGRDRGDGDEPSSGTAEDTRDIPDDFIEAEKPDISFDEIAGLDSVKERSEVICDLSDDTIEKEIRDDYGNLFAPEGEGNAVLLYGPPGCGKTMVSEAIATEYREKLNERGDDVDFFPVKASDILDPLSGMSEKRVSKAFEKARNAAKEKGFSILFLDEVEALIQNRSGTNVASHEKKLTAAFLQEMNKVGENMLVIGATNLPFNIDSAAGRRFKTEVFVPHPGEEGMAEFWEKKVAEGDIKPDENLDYEELGAASADFTPAEIVDRILGSEVQSEIVMAKRRGEEIPLNKDYFEEKLENAEPRDVDRYVNDIEDDSIFGTRQGYEELEKYVREQK